MTTLKDITILGAGVCGLYAAISALRRGASVTVIEKNKFPGGLAAGFQRGANFFDQGVHMLHATDPEIYEDIAGLMGDERIPVNLDARIRWNNRSYRYPLKGFDLLAGMSPFQLGRCVLGLVVADVQNRLNQTQAAAISAEDALIATYGDPLYEFFFKDFTHRYWNIHPSHLSAEFVRRKMPRLNVLDLVKKCLPKFPGRRSTDLVVAGATAEETLHYSKTGSETLPRVLANEVEKLGGKIIYGSDILEITPTEIRSSNSSVRFRNLLSTIPLPVLIKLSSVAPPAVLAAAKELKFKPIVTHGLLVRKNQCLEGLYTYYRNRIFHRVGEPGNAGLRVSPADHSVLIVEMTCDRDDPKWNDDPAIRKRVIDDLTAEGICLPEDIIEWHHFTNPHGYPIYQLHFEKHLATVQQWLDQQKHVVSTGRQGAFTYPGMHNAMRMGQVAVNLILSQS
jgi:protoporphyrinogen oxidase